VPLEHVAGIIEVPPGRYGDDRDPDGDREPIHERDQPEAGERAEDGDHRAAGHPEVGVVPLGSVPADGDERDAHQPVHDQVEEGGNLGEQLDLSGRRQDDDRSAGHAERYVWCAVSQVDPTRPPREKRVLRDSVDRPRGAEDRRVRRRHRREQPADDDHERPAGPRSARPTSTIAVLAGGQQRVPGEDVRRDEDGQHVEDRNDHHGADHREREIPSGVLHLSGHRRDLCEPEVGGEHESGDREDRYGFPDVRGLSRRRVDGDDPERLQQAEPEEYDQHREQQRDDAVLELRGVLGTRDVQDRERDSGEDGDDGDDRVRTDADRDPNLSERVERVEPEPDEVESRREHQPEPATTAR